jgi:1-acyl-sn-glycerol-3-phosphate acyltransferase
MGLVDDVRQVARGWRWTRRPMVPASVERQRERPEDFPTAWGRTPAVRALREVVQRYALGPVLHFEVDLDITGTDTLATLSPPAVFVLNHSSHLDAAAIVTALPTEWRRKAAVGAASDYFFDVWYRSISTTIVFNAFPIARAGGLRSARLARNLLKGGWSLVLFPEGTRTTDGWVGEFRTGAAWLAMEAQVPVVPVALTGTYQAMPRGRAWPSPGRPPVSVRFGKPVWAEPGERPGAFSDRLRFELGKVQEEERSGWWEATRAQVEGELVDPSGPRVAPWRRMWETSRPVPAKLKRSVWEPEKDEWRHEPLWMGTAWAPGVGEEGGGGAGEGPVPGGAAGEGGGGAAGQVGGQPER